MRRTEREGRVCRAPHRPEAPGNMSGGLGANTSFHGNLTVGPTVPVQTKPFDPEPRRESMRAALAMVLVAALLVLIGFLVVGVALSWLDIATAKDLATLALTPLAGLTGTVVGFYYAGGKG